MKYLILVLFLIAVLGLYLNRSYAHFYDTIAEKHLDTPFTQSTFLIEDPSKDVSGKKTTIKYLALGDSLSAGVGTYNPNQSFPYLIGQSLLQKSYEVTFIDIAVPGAESNDVLSIQAPRAIVENPDYITLLVGINDIHNLRTNSQFRLNYSEILRKLSRNTHAKITLINIPFLGLSLMNFPFQEYYLLKTLEFNKSITDVARVYNLPVVDLYSDTKDAFLQNPEYYSVDKFHPSAQGYQFWTKFINVN